MSIEVLNETDTVLDEMELVACSRYVLEEMKVHPGADLCLKLVDEAAMEVLHVQWMDLPGPTDVMSFPMDELRPGRDGQEPEEGVLGDIVLCPTVAARQAAEAGHATEEELLLLTTHGILHLLGYDHAEPDGGARDVRAAAHPAAHLPGRAQPPGPLTPATAADMTIQLRPRRARSACWSPSCSPRPSPRSCRMSRHRAAELVEEGGRGATALLRIAGDSAAYLSVAAFVRVVAEAAAAVLITLAAVDLVEGFWRPLLVSIGVMAVAVVRRWSGCPRAPWAASTPTGRAAGAAPVAGLAAPRPRPGGAAARRARQRGDAGRGLPRRAVRLRGRAARPGRPGRGDRADRGR